MQVCGCVGMGVDIMCESMQVRWYGCGYDV